MAELFLGIPTLVGTCERVICGEGVTVCPPLSVSSALIRRYHLIIPSLPGYTFSSKPPLDKDFKMKDIARSFGALMKGLGFTSYIAQGGDIGGTVIDCLAGMFPECKGKSD